MRPAVSAFAFSFIGFAVGAVFFVAASLVLAWTGPTSAPPNGNVSAPINVGTTDQIKNAGLAINALAVFGNSILQAASYLNWGSTSGSNGYGFHDNNGKMEFKNSGGSWQSMLSPSSTFSQIKFADGSTQTTAAAGGGITAVTTASCAVTSSHITEPRTCTVACPAGFYRTGCAIYGASGYNTGPQPSGSNGCYCFSGGLGATCYAYCAK
jgi:hypothetical protein